MCFGDTVRKRLDDVLVNWDAIKKRTKSQRSQSDVLKSVSPALPALMRSAKVQQKAAKVGFDWPDVKAPFERWSEELWEH